MSGECSFGININIDSTLLLSIFSRGWLFNNCSFISFIRIILIDRAYYLKENLIGIFPVGVVFLFIYFVKYIWRKCVY